MTNLHFAVVTFALFTFAPISPRDAVAQPSQKLVLDGELDYASAPDSPSLSFEGEDDRITIEAWIKHDGQSDPDARILDKFDNSDTFGGSYELHLVGSGEEVPIRFASEGAHNDVITSNSGIPAHRWTHVAVVDDGSTLSLYINGTLDETSNSDNQIFANDLALQIGTNETENGQFFSGQIDEVRIWNAARSLLEIKENRFSELTGSESGLVAYYPFSGGSPTTDPANGNDLIFEGDATAEPHDVLPVPPDLYVENEGNGQVSLHWEERTGLNNTNAASRFTLYQSPPTGRSGRAQIAQFSASKSFTHTETGLSNGKTYFWEVTSLDDEGRESDFSPLITGTPHDGSEPTPMKGGAALALDGNNDYGTVGDRPSLSFIGEDDSLTVEAWIKHDGQSDQDAFLLDKRDGRNGGYDLRLVGSGEEVPVRFEMDGPAFHNAITSNAGIPADRWTHVAVTYEGETLSLYLNGVLDASSSARASIGDNTIPLRIGANDAANRQFFSGRIDEVRVWGVARTQAQIQAHYRTELIGNERGLLGYWRFNETPGTAVSRAAGTRPKTVALSGNASFGDSSLETLVALSSRTVDTDGTVDFDTTGVDITFSGTSGSGDVIVEKFGSTPNFPNGISESNVSDYRFVFRTGSTLTFDANTEIRFDAGSLGGINTPDNVTIYQRATPSEGSFTALNTRYDGDANELVVSTGSFSEFVFASDTNPLPVELASFDAAQTGDDTVALTWTTASETNNVGFRVQHQGPQTESWTQLGFVDGHGTTTDPESVRDYRFTAEDLPVGTHRFRLQQVDADGSTHPIDPVTVELRMEEILHLRPPAPNPVQSEATFSFAVKEAQKTTITLFNVLGQRVATLYRGTPTAGETQTIRIHASHLSGLASGVYFLRLRAGNRTRSQQMTVVR